MKSFWFRMMVASAALLLVVIVGCNKSPVDSISSSSTDGSFDDLTAPSAFTAEADAKLVQARVKTIDQNRRMLTFEGIPDTVVANRNCQIVRKQNENEAPIPFVNIKQGDSCEVRCEQRQDGYLYAWHIKVCGEGNYDLAFRDTILTIDYALGQFTVIGRSETILVDSATVIFGVTPMWNGEPENENPGASAKTGPGESGNAGLNRVAYLFTDLVEGDVLEIRAKIVDENTLLAVYIKVANCEAKTKCVEFNSTVATLDYATRTITFADQAWAGWVCPKAELLDAAGVPLVLEDFVVGDAVAVKGLPLEDGTLKVNLLQKM